MCLARLFGAWSTVSRGVAAGAPTDSARATLFAAEGWDANIGFAGDPGIVEYAVTLPWDDAASCGVINPLR